MEVKEKEKKKQFCRTYCVIYADPYRSYWKAAALLKQKSKTNYSMEYSMYVYGYKKGQNVWNDVRQYCDGPIKCLWWFGNRVICTKWNRLNGTENHDQNFQRNVICRFSMQIPRKFE